MMRRLTITYFILLTSLVVTSCFERSSTEDAQSPLSEDLEAAEPSLPESTESRIIFRDRSGATLTVETGNTSPKVLLSAGKTEEFSVPVKIRFQGGESDIDFRRSTEMAPDEEDWWDFDDDKNLFEVGWSIAFLRSLSEADRVFLEIKLSETERTALVFDVEDRERGLLVSCLEQNAERVDNEMRALGLGKYAPPEPASAPKPAPLAIDLDEDAMFYLYDEYILLMPKISQSGVLPTPTEKDYQAIKATKKTEHPVSSMINYYKTAYPDAIEAAENFVMDGGFESIDQWAHIGDRIQIGMVAWTLDTRTEGHVTEVRGFTREEIASFEQGKREYVELIQAFSDREMEWFRESYQRFKQGTQ